MSDVGVKPDQLRDWADRCSDCADEIKHYLGPASDACDSVKKSADGWSFVDAVPQMHERWKNLNELLRNETGKAADNFRWCADKYDENENILVEYFRHLFS